MAGEYSLDFGFGGEVSVCSLFEGRLEVGAFFCAQHIWS